ncbi:MAG: hypothetical protein ACU0CA_13455 [Paracoccaceae bacterium]
MFGSPKRHFSGLPQQVIRQGSDITAAALLGVDFPGVHPAFEVKGGDRVQVGDVLFHDRNRSEIAFVSPLSGRISAIELGARRTVSALKIQSDAIAEGADSIVPSKDDARAVLLARGLWPAFRTRPFGRIPHPESQPAAIFVAALQSNPLAPDPREVIEASTAAFQCGVEILTRLTGGKVFVCQNKGADLAQTPNSQVQNSKFANRHGSGLIGACIHSLFPAGPAREIWTIDCQDVIAIGHLFDTGAYLAERVIALSGPRLKKPRLVKIVLGARIADLVNDADYMQDTPVRILSGPPQSGREAAYIGRYHQQVTVIDGPRHRHSVPHSPRFKRKVFGQGPRPIIAVGALNAALPYDIPVVPLMHALSIGDVEAAERLGCLELIEEDVAPLSALCSSGADYGALLRLILDELEGGN